MLKSDVIIERFIHSCTYTPSLQAKRLPLFLECTGHFVYGSRYFTEREGLNTYLLLFTIDGCGEIRTPQHRFAVPAGYAALVDGNTWHRYGSKDGTWEMSWIHFSGIGAAAYLSYLFDNGEKAVRITDRDKWLENLAAINILAEGEEDIRDVHICRIITEMLDAMIDDSRREARPPCSPPVEEAIRLIRRHFREPLTVAGLADQVHLSRYYFIRRFREQTGQSPYQYLTNLRINQSKKLLCGSEETVESVARQVGFSDSTGFIHSFKQLVGMTPYQYRKLYVTWMHDSSKVNL